MHSGNNSEAGFVAIGSKKSFQPLDFFALSGVGITSARVPSPWVEQGALDLAVVLEMRLETYSSKQTGLFGPGSISMRCCVVRKQVA